jgi:hypothetical protein
MNFPHELVRLTLGLLIWQIVALLTLTDETPILAFICLVVAVNVFIELIDRLGLIEFVCHRFESFFSE